MNEQYQYPVHYRITVNKKHNSLPDMFIDQKENIAYIYTFNKYSEREQEKHFFVALFCKEMYSIPVRSRFAMLLKNELNGWPKLWFRKVFHLLQKNPGS